MGTLEVTQGAGRVQVTGGRPVLNGLLAWAMLRKAREHRSMALEGDARHLFTDVWTSAGVIAGVGLASFSVFGNADQSRVKGFGVDLVDRMPASSDASSLVRSRTRLERTSRTAGTRVASR